MKVSDLVKLEGFTPLALPDGERKITGGYVGDLLSWVMGRAKSDCAWITIMSNVNIVAVATLADVACIILAEGVKPDKTIIETAEAKGINLLTTEMPAYETALALGSFSE